MKSVNVVLSAITGLATGALIVILLVLERKSVPDNEVIPTLLPVPPRLYNGQNNSKDDVSSTHEIKSAIVISGHPKTEKGHQSKIQGIKNKAW